MALKWVDGFDTYGTTIGGQTLPINVMARRYTMGGAYSYVKAARLGSGRSIRVDYSITTPALTTDPTLIIGAGLNFYDGPAYLTGTSGYFLHLYDGAVRGLYFTFDILIGQIRVYRDESTDVLLGITNGKFRLGAWNYVEFKVKCDDTTGTVDIRLNGVNVLSLSGIDTKATAQAHSYFDKVQFFVTSYPETWLDDLYICDGTGAKNNDFLGICKVETVFPVSDVGGKIDWTPSTPGDHYAMVDDGALCDDDTTYVEDSTTGHLDQFEFGNLGSFTALKGIMLSADCRETGATDFTLIQRAERTSVSEGSATAVTTKGYVETTQEGGGGVNEFQQVNLTVAYGGPTFTLTFDGQTTTAIAYNATTTTVYNALVALSNIGPNDVAVTGVPGAWIVEFKGVYANTNVPQMTLTMTAEDTHARIMEDDTEGADWTASNFDATQFGVKVG